MRVYLIKNKNASSKITKLTIQPEEEILHAGVEGSVEVSGENIVLTHAPQALGYPKATSHETDCFELDDDGIYAVEIDGVVQPYAFKAEQLPRYFNRKNPDQLMFIECKEDFIEENIEPEVDIIKEPPKVIIEQPS